MSTIPGVEIEVRAESLIGVGPIATGVLGIVGSASRGPVDEVVAIGSYTEARDIFGAYDAFGDPVESGSPLTLTRALEQAFAGGARSVFAVRAANGSPTAASLAVLAAGALPAFTLTAVGAGTWARDVEVSISSTTVESTTTWRMVLEYDNLRETYEGANVGEIHAQLGSSSLVTVGAVANGTNEFEAIETTLGGGANGAAVTTIDLARSLAALEDMPVNLVVVAGGAVNVVGNILLAHVERTENEGRERIAIVGAESSGTPTSATDIEANAAAFSDDRLVMCAPGIVTTDAATGATVTLPPAYTAPIVAGKLATLETHISLTNKALPMTPDVRYSSTLTERLLGQRVLIVRQKFGAQVVKGITTSGPPWEQITIRRTVDLAKAGVRAGSDPYIGRLNNARVRAALKGTLAGFLARLVEEEKLIDFSLDVSATRAQEIAGIASVVMFLKPTFSIDFIRVTMNLE